MTIFQSLVLALTTLLAPGVSGFQPDHRLLLRDGNERFPFCTPNPNNSNDCIAGGKYVKLELNISDSGNSGGDAYNTYLPAHTYTLSQWAYQKVPQLCHSKISFYIFQPPDFVVYNVTYSDCASPWVILPEHWGFQDQPPDC